MTAKTEAERLAEASTGLADEQEMIHCVSWVEIRNLLRADAAELRRLQSEVERLSNNRDMWKGQCARQASELEQLRAMFAAIRAEAKEE